MEDLVAAGESEWRDHPAAAGPSIGSDEPSGGGSDSASSPLHKPRWQDSIEMPKDPKMQMALGLVLKALERSPNEHWLDGITREQWLKSVGRSTLDKNAESQTVRDRLGQVVYEHSFIGRQLAGTMVTRSPFGATLGTFENEVYVDYEEMEEVDKVCDKSPDVISAVTNLIDNVLAGGLAVTMEFFGSSVKVSEMMEELFEVEWVPFLREAIPHLLKFGFVVVRLDQSNYIPTEVVPVVVPKEKYTLTIIDRFDKRRVYRVYNLEQFPRMQKKAGRQAPPPEGLRDGQVMVYVLPGYEPSADGKLRAPLFACVDKIRIMEHGYENFARTDYRASKPVYGVGSQEGPDTHKEVLRDQTTPEDDTGLYIAERAITEQEADYDRIRIAAEVSADRARAIAMENAESGAHGRLGPNPYSFENPYSDVFTPGIGHTLVAAPAPVFNPAFLEMTHVISGIVCGVLGIPMQLVSTSREIHAANAEVAFKMYDQRIRALQKVVQPIIQDLFDIANRGVRDNIHTTYAKEFIDDWASKEEDADMDDPSETSLLKDRVEEYISSSGKATQAGPGRESKPMNISRSMALGKKTGMMIVAGEDGKPRRGKFTNSKDPKTLSFDGLKKLISENVKIKIRFHHTPLTAKDDVQWAYDQNIIPFSTYARVAGEIIGFDPSEILSEEKSVEQAEKKRKTLASLEEKYGPDPNAAGPKKPAAAGAKKPAASSSAKPKSSASSGKK